MADGSGTFSNAIGDRSVGASVIANMQIGVRSSSTGDKSYEEFIGSINEVGIWERVLDPLEMKQLFQRGASRIKYQVKSCVESSCTCSAYSGANPAATDCNGDGILNTADIDQTGVANWLGNSGAGLYSYAEIQNCVSLDIKGNCDGEVEASSFDANFVDFPTVARPMDNRYFQYRVIMEAEENLSCAGSTTCLPKLDSIKINSDGRYYGGSPIISSTESINFSDITSITFSESGDCSITYQLSSDGASYYFWDGNTWTASSGENLAESSSAADISANITTYTTQVGAGDLTWKAFMTSDTTESCELSNINIIVEN